jgi:sugar phosphate permease
MKNIADTSPIEPLSTRDPEQALFRKITLRIVPFLFVCYVISFLDRINTGFAQLQLKHDLNFTDAMYGLGTAVFYLAYVIFEVPSNMLMAKIGARKTMVRIMFLWGLASAGMMFVSQPAHFYSLRFLLGMFEAGFFPGIVLYLSHWYPPQRRAAIYSVFYAGVAIAGVLGGLISGWIMRDMAGVAGLRGWQWLFFIEGFPAVILAVIAFFYLTDEPRHASWLSADEKARLHVALDGAHPVLGGHRLSSLLVTLRNPRVYLFAAIYFALTAATLTLNFWMPLIVQGFGARGVVSISLYTVIPNAVGALGIIVISRRSDRKAERRKHFAACTIGGAVALLAMQSFHGNFVLSLAILSIANALTLAALPIFWAVPTAVLSGPSAASAIALISSLGITSGIASNWGVGLIRTRTGSIDDALILLAVLLVASGLAMLGAGRLAPRVLSTP